MPLAFYPQVDSSFRRALSLWFWLFAIFFRKSTIHIPHIPLYEVALSKFFAFSALDSLFQVDHVLCTKILSVSMYITSVLMGILLCLHGLSLPLRWPGSNFQAIKHVFLTPCVVVLV